MAVLGFPTNVLPTLSPWPSLRLGLLGFGLSYIQWLQSWGGGDCGTAAMLTTAMMAEVGGVGTVDMVVVATLAVMGQWWWLVCSDGRGASNNGGAAVRV